MVYYPNYTPDLECTQGDTKPIAITILEDGQPVNLTGYTCTFYLADKDAWIGEDYQFHSWPSYTAPLARTGSVYNKVDGASMTLTNASGGVASWTPTADDTDTSGEYHWQVKYVSGSGVVKHFPVDPTTQRLRIHPSLA